MNESCGWRSPYTGRIGLGRGDHCSETLPLCVVCQEGESGTRAVQGGLDSRAVPAHSSCRATGLWGQQVCLSSAVINQSRNPSCGRSSWKHSGQTRRAAQEPQAQKEMSVSGALGVQCALQEQPLVLILPWQREQALGIQQALVARPPLAWNSPAVNPRLP